MIVFYFMLVGINCMSYFPLVFSQEEVVELSRCLLAAIVSLCWTSLKGM